MRIYFVSYCFPPLIYPRSVQVSRLAEYSKYPVHVIAGMDQGRKDLSLLKLVSEKNTIQRVPRHFSKLTDFLRVRFLGELNYLVPDLYTYWSQKVASGLMSQVTEEDLIVTFGNPMSDHLVGLALKNKRRCKWIAHFSDPWVDNPYARFNQKIKKLNEELEKKVILSVDRVLFTNDETRDLIMKKYDSSLHSKARVLNHAFDAKRYPIASVKKNPAEKIIRHLGNFYGNRVPKSLLNAVKLLEGQGVLGLKCEFYGSSEKGLTVEASSPLVSFKGSVSYLESLRLMKESDLLVVIDGDFEKNVFFPSKLADYLGSGRPILALSNEGPTRRIVGAIGGWSCGLKDEREIAKSIQEALIKSEKWYPSGNIQEYSAERVSATFDSYISELL